MSQLGGLSRALVSESLRARASEEGMQREAQQNQLRLQELQIVQQQMTLQVQSQAAQAAQEAQAEQKRLQREQQQKQEAARLQESARDAAALALSQQKNRQADVVRTALQQGVAVDPEIAREFGLLRQAAQDRRSRSATGGRTPSQIAESLSPQLQRQRQTPAALPLAATGAPPGIQGPSLTPLAGAGPQPIPAQDLEAEQLQALPPGTGVIVGQEGGFSVAPPAAQEIDPETQSKLDAIDRIQQAGGDPTQLQTLRQFAESLTVPQLINELQQSMPTQTRPAQTPLDKSRNIAARTLALIQTGEQLGSPESVASALKADSTTLSSPRGIADFVAKKKSAALLTLNSNNIPIPDRAGQPITDDTMRFFIETYGLAEGRQLAEQAGWGT